MPSDMNFRIAFDPSQIYPYDSITVNIARNDGLTFDTNKIFLRMNQTEFNGVMRPAYDDIDHGKTKNAAAYDGAGPGPGNTEGALSFRLDGTGIVTSFQCTIGFTDLTWLINSDQSNFNMTRFQVQAITDGKKSVETNFLTVRKRPVTTVTNPGPTNNTTVVLDTNVTEAEYNRLVKIIKEQFLYYTGRTTFTDSDLAFWVNFINSTPGEALLSEYKRYLLNFVYKYDTLSLEDRLYARAYLTHWIDKGLTEFTATLDLRSSLPRIFASQAVNGQFPEPFNEKVLLAFPDLRNVNSASSTDIQG